MPDARRLRVRFVCYRLDVAAGMERALLALVDALPQEWQIEVVVLRGPIAPPLAQLSELAASVVELSANPVRWARLLRRRPGADVEIVVGLWAALLWLPLRPRRRCPLVVWEHSLVAERQLHDARLRRLDRLVWPLYRRSSALVVVSEAARRFVASRLPRPTGHPSPPVRMIPNVRVTRRAGELRPAPTRRIPARAPRLLAMYRMTPLRNTPLLLEALQHLPGATLTCLGDGPDRVHAEQLATRLGLRNRVVFTGYVDDVTPFLDDAEVVVHPSRAETFCLAAFEAAEHGLPFACLSAGSLTDFVPDWVVGARAPADASPQDFARAITAAAALAGDSLAFSRAAERREAALAPDRVASRWIELIGELTGQRSPVRASDWVAA